MTTEALLYSGKTSGACQNEAVIIADFEYKNMEGNDGFEQLKGRRVYSRKVGTLTAKPWMKDRQVYHAPKKAQKVLGVNLGLVPLTQVVLNDARCAYSQLLTLLFARFALI